MNFPEAIFLSVIWICGSVAAILTVPQVIIAPTVITFIYLLLKYL